MARPAVPLADLIAAVAVSMAAANDRLAAAGRGALIRQLDIQLRLSSRVTVGEGGLSLGRLGFPSMQQAAAAITAQSLTNTKLTLQIIAAPEIHGVAPGQHVVPR